MIAYRILVSIGLLLMYALTLHANDLIFNLEAQSVSGYYSESKTPVWYSDSQLSEMQKPSLGFDLVQNISSDTKNYASLYLQYRLAWNEHGETKIENQFYNAFIKFKTPLSDISVGHIKPAFGFNSYVDNHALLMHNFTMHGMGYDRDWGAGFYKEFSKTSLNVTTTLGSGMPFYTMGNYLIAARIGYGYLNEDNYTIGSSVFHGNTLATHGVYLKNHDLLDTDYLGLDARYFWRNLEFNVDFLNGNKGSADLTALMYRQTINILEETRLRVDLQPVWVKANHQENFKLGIGVAYKLIPDVTLRTLFEYDKNSDDYWGILQIYFYKNLYTGDFL